MIKSKSKRNAALGNTSGKARGFQNVENNAQFAGGGVQLNLKGNLITF